MYNGECGGGTGGSPPSSIKHIIKSSICCFRSPPNEFEEPLSYTELRQPRSARSQNDESRSCRGLFSKIRPRKRPYSADFRYDPLSYALNFEDDLSREEDFPMSFSSRLPLSPDRPLSASATAIRREIVAFT